MLSKIVQLKEKYKEHLTILAHHYQAKEIVQLADFVGDSLELARIIPSLHSKYIIFAGVHFMAETTAVLARPNQHVFLPTPHASCVMANTAPSHLVEKILSELNQYQRVIPLAYVNSSAKVKAICAKYKGSVCTSANASQMLLWALSQGDAVLFLPDKNLGFNTAIKIGLTPKEISILKLNQKINIKNKKLILWPGLCAVHFKFKIDHIQKAKRKHPQAKIIVHPECSPEVVTTSDASGSTSFIINYVKSAPAKDIIYVGTEENLVKRLHDHYKPKKTILSLFPSYCSNMAKINLENLLTTLQNLETISPITLSNEICSMAQQTIQTMLKVCS
ncbi:MAG: quinolinate synthase NadA [Desulfonauticus sp.]|nr:quinolinate synthase NadA [Desulfonauticus sp.]